MDIAFPDRLSYKLARNTVFVAVLLGLVLNLIQVGFDYLAEDSALDKEIEAIMRISRTPAAQIAYNIDSRLAEELLEGLIKHPYIMQADIIDNDNQVFAHRERPIIASPYRWMSDLLFGPTRTYSTPLSVKQLPDLDLGTLNVVVDTYQSGIAFLKRAGATILSGFVKSLALSGLLLFVFYVMLTKPLLNIIAGLSEVDPESAEKARLPVPAGHENDEIGVLVNVTNNHLHTMESNLHTIRQAEGRLKTYTEHLEQIVDARTRELSEKNSQLLKSNRELVIAKEEAVRRAKARADFLANMSHEIRTPFNGVLGMISLTLEEPLSERQKTQLDIAYKSGISLLELLNDILDISKVEAGKLTLENISFDLRRTIEDIASLISQNAAAKNIGLSVYVQPDFPEAVIGDPTRIRQIINNLVGNAVKFTEKGYVHIEVTHDDQWIEIAVEDTGIGISNDALDKIFLPFAQAYSDTTRKFGGTGLGLALCRQLVHHMAGQLEVQSIEGKGSTFRVKLPLAYDREAAEPPMNECVREARFALVLESDRPVSRFIRDQLRYWSLNIIEPGKLFTSGLPDQEKINALIQIADEAQRPLVLILDDSRDSDMLPVAERPQIKIIEIGPLGTIVADKKEDGKYILHQPVMRRTLRLVLESVLGDANPLCTESAQPVTSTPEPNDHLILLVEDNRVNQMVAKSILKKLGYTVDIANNGQEAVDRVRSKHYDIILMDCHMPVMDGYEAAETIRTILGYKETPIIAVTANVMHGDKEKCFAAGMNDYITKPYEKHVLIEKLTHWLNNG